jgi:hypothetical protein
MLLRHRPPRIESTAAEPAKQGYEHLDESWLTLLRWLQASRVEFVLVGPAARAIRGEAGARGALTIVPAPYGRNLDRLAKALWAGHARQRVDEGPGSPAGAETVPVKLTAEKLIRSEGWTLRCGAHDIDVEGRRTGAPRYQELLYEATRFDLAAGLAVEVAAPEDIEHYDHVQRTGVAPEMRITRRTPAAG